MSRLGLHLLCKVILVDGKHLVFECVTLAGLRAKYADLFADGNQTVRSFFPQQGHLGFLHYRTAFNYRRHLIIVGTSMDFGEIIIVGSTVFEYFKYRRDPIIIVNDFNHRRQFLGFSDDPDGRTVHFQGVLRVWKVPGMPPTLARLPKNILLRALSNCSLEDAANLAVTEQSLQKAITPLLPRLCKLTDLQLLLCHPPSNTDGSVQLPSLQTMLSCAKIRPNTARTL